MDKLIDGIITLVVCAVITGQYGKLREFAQKEMIRVLTVKNHAQNLKFKPN